LPGAQNYQITATEGEGEVIFLHHLERGRASKSYGIEVARLAGLPPVVIANAREVLARLERYELDVFAEEDEIAAEALRRNAEVRAAAASQIGSAGNSAGEVVLSDSQPAANASANEALERATRRAGRRKAAAQASLFDLANQIVADEIRNADPGSLSPDEAKELLLRLRERIV